MLEHIIEQLNKVLLKKRVTFVTYPMVVYTWEISLVSITLAYEVISKTMTTLLFLEHIIEQHNKVL